MCKDQKYINFRAIVRSASTSPYLLSFLWLRSCFRMRSITSTATGTEERHTGASARISACRYLANRHSNHDTATIPNYSRWDIQEKGYVCHSPRRNYQLKTSSISAWIHWPRMTNPGPTLASKFVLISHRIGVGRRWGGVWKSSSILPQTQFLRPW